MAREFRVRWRREGMGEVSRIYQREAGARGKAERVLALEACKGETSFADMPDLEMRPVIDVREVGEWERAALLPDTPSAEAVDGMREWAAPNDSDNYGPF